MNLVLDIGNTAIKAAWFEGDKLLIRKFVQENNPGFEWEKLEGESPKRVIFAAVKEVDAAFLKTIHCQPLQLTATTPLPISNLYKTPTTLGADRIANAVGAWKRFPDRNVLVVDAGTCLKLDLVTADQAYVGGSIAPGVKMRYSGLHTYTGRLPFLELEGQAQLTGTTTAESIHSGIINGMLAEIEGMIARYQEIYTDLALILTGGDASLFFDKLKSRIFAAPTLTLEGLNAILLHND